MLLELISSVPNVVNPPEILLKNVDSYLDAATRFNYNKVPMVIVDDVFFGGYTNIIGRRREFISYLTGIEKPTSTPNSGAFFH